MDPYLIKILNEKNRVIIPDFGAFIVKQKNPRKIIFNEFLQYNDGALVDAISREEKIDRDEAMRKINVFVNDLRKKLSTGKTVNVAGLGELSQNPTGKIDLKDSDAPTAAQPKPTDDTSTPEPTQEEITTQKEPEIQEDIPIESIDLNELESEQKVNEDSTPDVPSKDKDTVEPKIPEEKVAKEQPVATTKIPTEEQKKPEPKPRPMPRPVVSPKTPVQPPVQGSSGNRSRQIALWITAIVVINGAIIGYFLFNDEIGKLFGKKESEQIAPSVTNTDAEAIATTDTSILEGDDSPTGTIIEESSTMPVEEEETTQPDRQITGKKYYIVAGVFQVEQNADKLVDDLRKRGYNATKFGKIGAYHAVSYDVFPTKAEADKYLKQIHSKEDPDAWIKVIN